MAKPVTTLTALITSCALLLANPVNAAGFIDEDGWLDGSDWLLENAYGFLPVPIIITEPAVGFGAGAALAFFHDSPEARATRQAQAEGENARFIPPGVSVVAAAVTENDTWFVGGGHINNFRKDTIRYRGFGGYGSFNLDFFGVGTDQDQGFSFNAKGALLQQDVEFRLGQSNWLLGANYQYATTVNTFDFRLPNVSPLELDSSNAAVGFIVHYDGIDNPYAPSNGINLDWNLFDFARRWGGDFDYQALTAKNHIYLSPTERLNIGIKADAQLVEGDAPFYGVPFVELRGVPAMRYQDKAVISSEVQALYQFHPRWQLLGFGGIGLTGEKLSELKDNDITVYGGGFRYLGVKKLGISMGIDIARGPEETVFYLQVGTAFR